ALRAARAHQARAPGVVPRARAPGAGRRAEPERSGHVRGAHRRQLRRQFRCRAAAHAREYAWRTHRSGAAPHVARGGRRMSLSQLVPMSIKGLMLDPVSNSPIVVLKDDEEKFFLPIWVGIFEANAIALQLENVTTPRPMTHDLLKNMIAELDGRVTRVVINDLRDSTFFAQIRVITGQRTLELDARPSDAIALALRVEAPIFVAQTVLEQAQTITPESADDEEKVKKWFEQLGPDELGKYKM